ncbi:MAG: EAL domain-containing protein [Mesorhizobium sp.]
MSRNDVLAGISREPDGSSVGLWSVFVLRTALQPIYAFRPGKLEIVAYEALLRPFRGGRAVSPDRFFSNIEPQDRAHVEALSRSIHILNAGKFLDPSVSIFINFDPSIFAESEIAVTTLRDLRLVMHEAGIPSGRLVCEVTEKAATSETALVEFVASAKEKGFRIAVDDYGAEESDLHRIERLGPDIVKFDGAWSNRLMRSKAGFNLLTTLVASIKSTGATTVLEGLESSRNIELAELAGADMVQSYALARPDIVPGAFVHSKV